MEHQAADREAEGLRDLTQVKGVGEVVVHRELPPTVARNLLAIAMDPGAPELGPVWLEAATNKDRREIDGLTDAAQHRLKLAVLKRWDLWPAWKRLYGSHLTNEERLRRVLLEDLRRQARWSAAQTTHRHGASVIDLAQYRKTGETLAGVANAGLERISAEITRPVNAGLERISAEIARPVNAFAQRIAEWTQPIAVRLGQLFTQFVRAPAFRQSVRFLAAQQAEASVAITRPIAALLRARDRSVLGGQTPRGQPEVDSAPSDALLLPDDATLVAFYGEERADAGWRTGPLGWLLTNLPLQVGATLHSHFGKSAELALGWVADQFARHELRRGFLHAIDTLGCSPSLRERLEDGVGHFLAGRWSSADSLLTVGLEGLLFEIAQERGLTTPGRRLIQDGKARGQIKTAADGRLLHALGLTLSEQAYLTELSVGVPGNPPRHGQDAEFGSMEHSAAVMLAIVMLALHKDRSAVAVASLLDSGTE